MNQRVAILDAGAQYGKVIDRRVRELGVESILLPLETPVTDLQNYAAIIISGGPESVYDKNAPSYDPDLFSLQKPILGICYGMQLMTHHLGGVVEKKDVREDGASMVDVVVDSPLFEGTPRKQQVLLTHGDTVDTPAPGFRVSVDSEGLIAGVENVDKQYYGVQFHPEVDLTEHGQDIFSRFLFDIAAIRPTFTVEDRMQKAIAYLQEHVGDKNVVVLVSGGVDSSVTAALLAKAVDPKQIKALHIDSGFMRKDESSKVIEALSALGLKIEFIDAQKQFSTATTEIDGEESLPLNQVVDPQVKRKIIGDTFVRVTQQVMESWDLDPAKTILAQGSLRPDLIESALNLVSTKARLIKTHHNDTDLVRKLRNNGQVVEPLQEYHKDEVRQLGLELGLPEEIVWRQPFPGPGLAIRVLCAEEPYLTDQFDAVEERVKEVVSDTAPEVSATLLPVRTVGVQGDGRTFSYLVGLSGAFNASKNDSKSSQIDWDSLFELARSIPKRVHQVNRIVYLFGQPIQNQEKEVTKTWLIPEVVDQLREADDITNQTLRKYDLLKTLSQVPVTSFPIGFGTAGNRSIGIRTFITNDFMTGIPATPGKEMPFTALDEMVSRIEKEVKGVSRVAYDLTSKPPGTTEWE